MPWYYGPDSGWMTPLTMVIAMLLFWGGLLTAVVLLLRHFAANPLHHRDAERMLAERLARGEIDETEYAKVREILRTHR